jgi:Uma2 family endonuclease
MPTTDRDTRLTYEDLLRFPDDGLRHELIDGVHYVTASPAWRHQELLGRLYLAMGNHLAAHPGIGHVVLSPFDTVFSQWDVVEPDLIFVATSQLDIVTEANIQGAPALVVEILSPSTRKRDLGIKQQLFDRGGVREYWVVDPVAEDVTVYRRGPDGSLAKVSRLTVDDKAALSSPLLPGFELPVETLFARLLPDRR